MRIRVVTPDELGADLRRCWSELLDSSPPLGSPFFHPCFTEVAGRCRHGVRVAVMEDGGRTVGFFPFERNRFGFGWPVGGRLSDYQGVVADGQREWSVDALMSGSRLKVWRFDHLLREQKPFEPYFDKEDSSPVIELSGGFEEYCKERRRSGSGRIDQFLRKSRKMSREIEDVRFELDSRDERVLDQVIAWKRQQCVRTGVVDFFASRENTDLVRGIFEQRNPDFSGVLSVLWARGEVAAAHFGMRSKRVLHWWFPVYNHELGSYSPGGVILLELLKAASEIGVGIVDLGKGDDAYKSSFKTSEIPLAEGEVVRPSLVGAVHKARVKSEEFLRSSSMAGPIRAPLRTVRRWMRAVRRRKSR